MTLRIGIYDHATGETYVRDMTPDEIADYEAAAAETAARKEAERLAAEKREAVLAALAAAAGLEIDEVKAALG